MLTYTFSGREKAMILALVIVVVFLLWFVMVYQRTTNEITRLDSEIATIDSETTVANARVSQMQRMERLIEQYKESGAEARVMPTYDNTKALMAELDSIMSAAETYTLSFEDLDKESSPGYVLRNVRVEFGCDSYDTVESIIDALETGSYPCSVDSVSITDNTTRTGSRVSNRTTGSSTYSSTVNVTFVEKMPDASSSGKASSSAASTNAA